MIELDRSVLSGSERDTSVQFINFAKQVREVYGNKDSQNDQIAGIVQAKNDLGMEYDTADIVLDNYSTNETQTLETCLNESMNDEHKPDQWFEQEVNVSVQSVPGMSALPVPGINGRKISDQRKFQCKVCEKFFARQTTLNRHMKLHQAWLEKCTICNMFFNSDIQLDEHNENFHATAFQCMICKSFYRRKSVLLKHLRTVHPEYTKSKFVCPHDQCKTSFDEEEDYFEHLTVHENVKPYECQQCSKTFSLKSGLKQHETKHCKDPLYIQCEQCGKTFKGQGALCNHKQSVHKGIRYVCSVCGKIFRYKSGYSRHIANHEKDSKGQIYEHVMGIEYVESPEGSFEQDLKTEKDFDDSAQEIQIQEVELISGIATEVEDGNRERNETVIVEEVIVIPQEDSAEIDDITQPVTQS